MPVEKHEFDVFGDPVKVRHYVKNGVVHTEISGLGVDFSLPLNAGQQPCSMRLNVAPT